MWPSSTRPQRRQLQPALVLDEVRSAIRTRSPVGGCRATALAPGMPISARLPARRGIAPTSRRVYGCAALAKSSDDSPTSTSRPAYITATCSARVDDHSEVVADVQRRHLVGCGQVAHRVQHVGLGGHVEPGGGLVKHDQARAAGERHRQPDPLLLAAGQLVGVAAQVARVVGQRHLAHHLGDAVAAVAVVGPEVVRLEHLAQLGADAQGWVERGGWILRHV